MPFDSAFTVGISIYFEVSGRESSVIVNAINVGSRGTTVEPDANVYGISNDENEVLVQPRVNRSS